MNSSRWFGSGLLAGALALATLTFFHFCGCAFCCCSGSAGELPTLDPHAKAPDVSQIRGVHLVFPNFPGEEGSPQPSGTEPPASPDGGNPQN